MDINKKTKYFIFPVLIVLLFLLVTISQCIGVPFRKNITASKILEFFIKILFIAGIVSFIVCYYLFGKKYFIKIPKKISFGSWANYTLIWGLLYAGLYMTLVMPAILFCGLLFYLPIRDAFKGAIDILFGDLSYRFFAPISGFVTGNIGYFYYGIFKPWWQKM
jgi:hypothetical protein